MSEDASPTGGQRTPPKQDAAADSNSSLIEKVRSRVSSIIPFSKWFSPTTGAVGAPSGEDGSRNGGIRRRREETVIRERVDVRHGNLEDSDIEDPEEDEADLAPPSKRSRLNASEIHSPIGSFQNAYANVTKSFASSTPTTIGISRRKLVAPKTTMQTLRSTTSNASTRTIKTTTIASPSISDLRSENDDDVGDADVLEIIPEHRHMNFTGPIQWERSQLSSDRNIGIRDLKLPSRRPSLHAARGNGPSTSYSAALASSYYRHQNEDEPQFEAQAEEDDYDEKKSDILTNGVRASPILISADTASESGESQMSSTQKGKGAEGVYGAGVKRFRSSAVGGISYTAHLQGKKSLFGDKNMPSHLNNSTTSLTSLNRRQSFNASLYGSTSALSDSRLLNIYSPFYKGCTTYGGASAYSKHLHTTRRVNPSSASLVRPSSSLSTSSTASNIPETPSAISNTAKRILELMNQFTTPLSDVKKMASNMKVPALTAHRQRFGDADRSMSRGVRMTIPKTPYSRITRTSAGNFEEQKGPPLNELHVPSMSQLLQMKKLQSGTERAREITRMNQAKCLGSIPDVGKKQEYQLPPTQDLEQDKNSSLKHVNKIKNKLTSARSSAKTMEEDPVQAPALPDIPLPLKESAVPVINIDIKKSIPQSKLCGDSSVDSGIVTTRGLENSNGKLPLKSNHLENSMITSSKNEFSFSSPAANALSQSPSLSNKITNVSTDQEARNAGLLSNGGQDFIFAPPIQVLGSHPLESKENLLPGSTFTFSDPAPIPTVPKSSNAVNNFTYQFSSSSKPASVLASTPKSNSVNSGSIPAVAAQLKTSGSVMDAFKKPMSADSTSAGVSSSSAAFGAQFKMSSDEWECSTCLVRNDKTVDKCISCTTPKSKPPIANTTVGPIEGTSVQTNLATSMPVESVGSNFGDKFKPTSDTWECPTCMIRNNSNLSECEACSTANPTKESSATASTVSSSSFKVPNKTLDPGFKSIVAEQAAKWECSACMTHNEAARNKCACCEQAKPGAVSDAVPQFSFGTSASTSAKFSFGFTGKKEEDLKKEGNEFVKKSLSNPAGEVKKGFVFGAVSTHSSSTSTATPASFSFGLKSAANNSKNAESKASNNSEPNNSSASKPTLNEDSSKPSNSNEDSAKSQDSTKAEKTETDASKQTFKFGTPISASAFSSPTSSKSAAESKSSVVNNPSPLSSSSIFKPIGNVAFAASTEKKSEESSKPLPFSFGSGTLKTASAERANSTAASVTDGKGANTLNSDSRIKEKQIFPTEISNATCKLFGFSSTSSKTDFDQKSSIGNKSVEFNFGTQSPLSSAGGIKSMLGQKLETTTASKTSATSASFVFGKPSTPASVTPTFGAISSNVITSSNPSGPVSTTAPSFSGNAATIGTPSTMSTFQPVMAQTLNSSAFGGSSGPTAATSLFGNNNLSSASSSNSTTANKPASNLFQFGSGTKPAESTATTASASIFGNVSSTTSARFSFGSSSSATSASPAPFVFGSSANADKRNELPATTNIFAAASNPVQNSAAAPPLPGFGSFSSPSALQTQQSPLQPAQPSAFGQTPSLASPFGSNLSSGAPTFGSTAGASAGVATFGSGSSTFGASGASAFGSPAAKIPLFSSGFGSASASSGDNPAAKKQATGFNFNTPQQNSTSGFSFSASNINNNNTNKQPFTFSTAAPPSFNFTGAPEATNASQPFQFGAPQIPPAAFNFSGIETASNAPFQFSAAPAANNIFAVTPTPGSSQSAVQMRRKAKIATRRTQPR